MTSRPRVNLRTGRTDMLKTPSTVLVAITCVFLAACNAQSGATSPTASGSPPPASASVATYQLNAVRPSSAESPASSVPLDVLRLGSVSLATPVQAAGAISQEEAISRAANDGYAWPNPDSYLVVMTRASTTADDQPMSNRLVWLLRWDDLNVEFPAPHPASGSPSTHPYRYGYVYVDALTGDVLGATYMD